MEIEAMASQTKRKTSRGSRGTKRSLDEVQEQMENAGRKRTRSAEAAAMAESPLQRKGKQTKKNKESKEVKTKRPRLSKRKLINEEKLSEELNNSRVSENENVEENPQMSDKSRSVDSGTKSPDIALEVDAEEDDEIFHTDDEAIESEDENLLVDGRDEESLGYLTETDEEIEFNSK